MKDRFSALIENENLNSLTLKNIGGAQFSKSIKSIISRLKSSKLLKKECEIIHSHILKLKVDQIYLSNSEGYIALNVIDFIRRFFPNVELISIQHGVFPLEKIRWLWARKLLNGISYLFFKIKPLGLGFGPRLTDKYCVYNQSIKNFLIDTYNWKEGDIMANLNFIKPDLFQKKEKKLKRSNTAVFLLQALYQSGVCTQAKEKKLNENILRFLLERHDKILIKPHPAFQDEVKYLNVNSDRIVVELDLIKAFNNSYFAYSYFSTSLVDAELFEIQPYAIYSKWLKVNKSIYLCFSDVIDIDEYIKE